MTTRVRLTGMNLNEAVDLAKDLGCTVEQPSANGEFFFRHPTTGPRPCVVNGRRTDAPRHLTQMLKRLLREQRPDDEVEDDDGGVDASPSPTPVRRDSADQRRDRMVSQALADADVFVPADAVEVSVRPWNEDLVGRSEVSFYYSRPDGQPTNFGRVSAAKCDAYFYGMLNPAGDGFARWVALDASAFRDWWGLAGSAGHRKWVRPNLDGSERMTIPVDSIPDGVVLGRLDGGFVPLPLEFPKAATQPLFARPMPMPAAQSLPEAVPVQSPVATTPPDPIGRFASLRAEMADVARSAIDVLLAKRSGRMADEDAAAAKLVEAKAAVRAVDDEIAKVRAECEAMGLPMGGPARSTSKPDTARKPAPPGSPIRLPGGKKDHDGVMDLLNSNRGVWLSASKIRDAVRTRRPVCIVLGEELSTGAVEFQGDRAARKYRVPA